jgi:hypothetical protein
MFCALEHDPSRSISLFRSDQLTVSLNDTNDETRRSRACKTFRRVYTRLHVSSQSIRNQELSLLRLKTIGSCGTCCHGETHLARTCSFPTMQRGDGISDFKKMLIVGHCGYAESWPMRGERGDDTRSKGRTRKDTTGSWR